MTSGARALFIVLSLLMVCMVQVYAMPHIVTIPGGMLVPGLSVSLALIILAAAACVLVALIDWSVVYAFAVGLFLLLLWVPLKDQDNFYLITEVFLGGAAVTSVVRLFFWFGTKS